MLELDPTTWIKSAVIVRRNLGRNFIAHLASFSSVGAVKFTTIYDCMLRLQQCMKFKDKLALTEYNLPWRESYMDQCWLNGQPEKVSLKGSILLAMSILSNKTGSKFLQ